MTVKKSCNQVCLVAVDFAGLAAPHKVSKQSLGNFRIRVRSERVPQHRGRDGHIEQVQPAIHLGKSFRQAFVGVAKRDFVEPARNGHIAAERVAHQLLIKTLDCRQDCQFKSKILGQETLSRERDSPLWLREFLTAV